LERAETQILAADAFNGRTGKWAGPLRKTHGRPPARVAVRLPHLTAHDLAEIDREVRAALTEVGES
jgi:phage terminase Nu1 subunit (DNA packaging protein)